MLRPGLALLTLAGLCLGLHVWLALGLFVPIARDTHIEYVLVSASFETFFVAIVLSWTAVFGVHLLLRSLSSPRVNAPALFSIEDTRYGWPLCLFAVSLLDLLNLVPSLNPGLPVLSYLLVDLRWWWTFVVLAWTAIRTDDRFGGLLRHGFIRRISPVLQKRGVPETALVVIGVAWVVASTPELRFSGSVDGDEPKYLRYCENFYQGLGFEVTSIQPIAALPAGFTPQFGRDFVLLETILPGELRQLYDDTRAWIGDPSRRFNRASSPGNWFFTGKAGGIYQVHTPGLAFLMLPAYSIDRWLIPAVPGSAAQWPSKLPAVNVFFLTMYAIWVVLIFRLLGRVTQAMAAAWLATAAVVLTFPLSAFPFHFYPEVPAGIILILVVTHLLSPTRRTLSAAIACGILVGFLIWLHVRFSAAAFLLAVAAMVLLRREPLRAGAFALAFLLVVACFCLYAYRLTGSIVPSAMYSVEGTGQVLSWVGVPNTALGFLFDRDLGVLAHAPVYLMAAPGFWWLTRRRRDAAWLCALVFLALLIPASAHSLLVGTPTRTILAALPLLGVPMAELLARRWHSRAVQVAFVMTLIASLHTALAYNATQRKLGVAWILVENGFSGWNINLLFPADSRRAWSISTINGGLLLVWMIVLLLLLAGPAVRQRFPKERAVPAEPVRQPSLSLVAFTVVTLFVVLATMASGAAAALRGARYQLHPRESANLAAAYLGRVRHCTICASSEVGVVTTDELLARVRQVTEER